MIESEQSGNLLLFSYLLNNNDNRNFVKSLKIALGRFVAKYIRSHKPYGLLISIDTINKLDRIILAKQFLEEKPDLKEKVNIKDKDQFFQDIAQYIDLKIPYHYWVHIQEIFYKHNLIKFQFHSYNGIQTIPNLIYIYSSNYEIEIKIVNSISEMFYQQEYNIIQTQLLEMMKTVFALEIEKWSKAISRHNEAISRPPG